MPSVSNCWAKIGRHLLNSAFSRLSGAAIELPICLSTVRTILPQDSY